MRRIIRVLVYEFDTDEHAISHLAQRAVVGKLNMPGWESSIREYYVGSTPLALTGDERELVKLLVDADVRRSANEGDVDR